MDAPAQPTAVRPVAGALPPVVRMRQERPHLRHLRFEWTVATGVVEVVNETTGARAVVFHHAANQGLAVNAMLIYCRGWDAALAEKGTAP